MSTAKRETIAVVIPTKNAAQLVNDALDSVSWADEIIVVDRFSTDETEGVVRRFPQARFFKRDDHIFLNANFGFEQAASDWVLRLDADERLTPELSEEILTMLQDPPRGVTGFECRERVFILGRELRHGFGRPHFRKMLWRRGAARYPGRSEHESLETSGQWKRTEHPYLHYNYSRVRDYLEKTNYYTDADIERSELPERAPGVRKILVETARAFYFYYLKRQGFRDGWVGLLDAGMRAFYQFVSWSKLRERWERERGLMQEPR